MIYFVGQPVDIKCFRFKKIEKIEKKEERKQHNKQTSNYVPPSVSPLHFARCPVEITPELAA